jgi:nicotinate phosphoribosyltransferase
MSVFDGKRLPPDVFKLDVERMRRGWYSDKYFERIMRILRQADLQGYRFQGEARRLPEVDLSSVDVGTMEVEMQWFPRRTPFCVLAGVDKALAMLQTCTGYFDDEGQFVNTYDQLEVWAAQDGQLVPYDGAPLHVTPVLRVRGRYRDFAILETPTIGALTRGSRIATNVYEIMCAAAGKPVFFFPARFDAHEIQAMDGYAYRIGVELFNRTQGAHLGILISTDAQGDWWGGAGGGTVAHAAIACFLGDISEAMLAFARYVDPEVPRIALVDFENDSVGDSLRTMRRMFALWAEQTAAGDEAEAQRYKLHAVRLDTSGHVRDVNVPPLGDRRLDCGVNPRLVWIVRDALDQAWRDWDIPAQWRDWARDWCRDVKIVATGGFDPERIRLFESLAVPVDYYGVGSWLMSNCSHCGTSNDFTADVVRIKINGEWRDLAKVGRTACDNAQLEPVQVPAM